LEKNKQNPLHLHLKDNNEPEQKTT
jgi:hypothetical protein